MIGTITRRCLVILTLSWIGLTCLYGQAGDSSEWDSLLNKSELTAGDYAMLEDHLFNLNYYQSDRYDELYHKAFAKALGQGEIDIAARLQTSYADDLYETDRDDSSKYYITSAVALYKSIGDELGYARTANVRRLIATVTNDFLDALDVSYEALEIFQKYDDQVGMAIAYRDIGSVLLQEQKYQEGLDYCLRSVDALEEAQDWYELQFTYQRLAIAYKNLGDFEQAHRYISKSIDACRRLQYFRSNQGLANKYWTVGYIYEAEGEFSQAIAYYDSANYYGALVGYEAINKWVNNSKGGIYIKQGRYSEALLQFEKTLQLGNNNDTKTSGYDFYLPVYANLLECYKGLGDYKKALEVQELISEAKDSSFTIASEAQALELRTKYETTQKEQRILTLQKDKRNQRILLGLGALVLLMLTLLALFLMRGIRYRNRTNALLQGQKEEIIKKSNHNEMLVKEIHHRVKNNLQILSSLLSLQSDAEENQEVLGALQEGRNRVESMGMIHQRLYSNDNITAIDMRAYVPDLCGYLMDMTASANGDISIKSDVKIGLVDVETAIPLGLIINELITNSLKYAFEVGQSGDVKVHLWIDSDDDLCLHVFDNGIGQELIADNIKSTKFGSQLVTILSKKLKGDIKIDNTGGYSTSIRFKRYKLLS